MKCKVGRLYIVCCTCHDASYLEKRSIYWDNRRSIYWDDGKGNPNLTLSVKQAPVLSTLRSVLFLPFPLVKNLTTSPISPALT